MLALPHNRRILTQINRGGQEDQLKALRFGQTPLFFGIQSIRKRH